MDDAERLAELGAALADAVEAALTGWVERSLARYGQPPDASVAARAVAAVVPDLRLLLALDVDEQRQGPLSVVRRAVPIVSEHLAAARVPPASRDDQQRELFPDDLYDLVPASFADLSPEAGDAGIAWGAAKAFVHRSRHA